MKVFYFLYSVVVIFQCCLNGCLAILYTNSRVTTHQPIRYALITMQHSGSHFFVTTIGQQVPKDKIVAHGELCVPTRKDWAGIDCITRVKLMYGLPDIDFDMFDNSQWISKFPKCSGAAKVSRCVVDTILSASLVSMIFHSNHGWENRKFLISFLEMKKQYEKIYNINIKLVVLQRTNAIAYHIASSSVKRDTNEVVEQTQLNLKDVVDAEYDRNIIYKQLFATLPDDSWCIYVTYEHLLRHHETFAAVASFIGFSTVAPINVTEDTKHHSNQTSTYILNLPSVIQDLRANNYPSLNECQLYDNCEPSYPDFCKNPKFCFI